MFIRPYQSAWISFKEHENRLLICTPASSSPCQQFPLLEAGPVKRASGLPVSLRDPLSHCVDVPTEVRENAFPLSAHLGLEEKHEASSDRALKVKALINQMYTSCDYWVPEAWLQPHGGAEAVTS